MYEIQSQIQIKDNREGSKYFANCWFNHWQHWFWQIPQTFIFYHRLFPLASHLASLLASLLACRRMAGCHRHKLEWRWNPHKPGDLLACHCTSPPPPSRPRWGKPGGSRRRWGCSRPCRGSAWEASLPGFRQSSCTSELNRRSTWGLWPRRRQPGEGGGEGGASCWSVGEINFRLESVVERTLAPII